jgi:hypothetical protein
MSDLGKLAVLGVLIAGAATGILGAVVTPAANWFGHHEAELITKQVHSNPNPSPTHR